jgi:two-component system, sensor histidine kinase SagS
MERPKLLLIGPPPAGLRSLLSAASVQPSATPADAADRLHTDSFDGVIAEPGHVTELIERFRRDETILATVDQGIAALDPHGRITWANPTLRSWCHGEPVGQSFLEALGPSTVAADNSAPLKLAATGVPVTFRLHRSPPAVPYLDVQVRPVLAQNGQLTQLVAVARNVTSEVEQQKKLDALHQAGRDLAALEADQLAEMNQPTRVELLKQNLRRYIHDLLHYDIIELRLLDRQTGELKPLLEDGMTPEAAARILHARPTENGVTGFVAFTRNSYLCPDAANDPHYIEGAKGARSSLTVPLIYNDEVVGTLNVESPRTDGFGPDDLQFTELFSKEIAAALHTLDLLTAQQSCTISQSIEAVNREIALPVDEILATAALLYARLHAADPQAGEHLRKILNSARHVKANVRKVGADMTAPGLAPLGTQLAGKRVLVVDQDERFRRQAHLLLGRLGAAVETVATAAEGHALVLDDDGYDAVFQEIRPSDMSGYDAFRQFRVTRPTMRVALTTGFGYDSAHTVVKAKADGLQHMLYKPFRADQVVGAVHAAPPPPPKLYPVTAASCGHS